jgi:hypothetical protein
LCRFHACGDNGNETPISEQFRRDLFVIARGAATKQSSLINP